MNKLPAATRSLVLRCLMDGMSVRGTCLVTGAAKRTVLNLLVEAGEFCEVWSDFRFQGLAVREVQVDEQWGYIGSKQRNAKAGSGHGDIWVYAGIDSETKLLFSWLVGARVPENTFAFMQDIASRVVTRLQLTSDGWREYPGAVRSAFGFARCDFAVVQKIYGQPQENVTSRRYSPAVCTGAKKVRMIGLPDMAKVSTSFIERLNLNTRMNCRRMTRLSNGFSRKHQNHAAALALTFWGYNYCKANRTLTKQAKGIHTTPAMAAKLADRLWTADDLIAMMDGAITIGSYRVAAHSPASAA
jgi:IS1 family transposase